MSRIHTAECRDRLTATHPYFHTLYVDALTVLDSFPSAIVFPEDLMKWETVHHVQATNVKKIGVSIFEKPAIPKNSGKSFDFHESKKKKLISSPHEIVAIEHMIFQFALGYCGNNNTWRSGSSNCLSFSGTNMYNYLPVVQDQTQHFDKTPVIDIPYTVNKNPPGKEDYYSTRRGVSHPRESAFFGDRNEAIAYAKAFFDKNMR